MKIKYLLYSGLVIPAIFWITTFICGFIQGDYNHFSRLVSELGAIGTSSQYFFTVGLILCSILSILFVTGLYKSCRALKLSTVPVLIILFYSVSIAGAAIFPLPLRLHEIMGMPSILLILSPLFSLFLWNGKNKLPMITQMSILSLIVMLTGFLVYFPDVLSNSFGLKQRFFHFGWSIWFIYLSFSFLRITKEKMNIKVV